MVTDERKAGWTARVRHRLTNRVVAVLAALALVATTFVLGEPSRPATATVVRPIVTVQALCTAPTIIDVAAGEATRGLSAVGSLLGLEEPLVQEAARDVTIRDTDAGTFFVSIRDGELRLAILRPTGLPALASVSDDGQAQTYRAFDLPAGLVDQQTTVVTADDAVYVLFADEDTSVSAIRLDSTSLTSDTASLSAGRAPSGVEVADPAARPGTAVAHAGALWVATDDGTVWTYDAAADAADRWVELADGLDGGVLTRDNDLVYGMFAASGGGLELRGYATPGSEPAAFSLRETDLAVEAASFRDSKAPGFVVRGPGGDARAGILAVGDDRPEVAWTEGDHAADPAVGLLVHEAASSVLTDAGGELTYHVLDHVGGHLGSFGRLDDEAECTAVPGWQDAATVVSPLAAGPFLHLHHPASQFDCIVDTRENLDGLEDNCAPEGPWSLDKGAAPESDFTIEIERSVGEFRDDLEDDAPEESEDGTEPDAPDEADEDQPERLESELSDVGLGIQEVDEDLTEICAAEEVTAVVAPELDALDPVGDSAVRVDWTWAGGRCLPERYEIELCLVSSDGDGCSETRNVEVVDRDGASNRLSNQVSTRPGRSYRVNVTAFKKGIASSPSNTLSVTTPPAVPAPPDDVSGSLSSNGVWELSWASCLDDRSCDQRPEGFQIAIRGCDGDSLQRMTQTVGASERSVSYDVNGSGFQGTDLLGRKVQFTVAASAAGYVSDEVAAGSCAETTRPGRTVSAGNSPVAVSLSGRTTSMTLELPGRGSGFTSLFGTSSYDDISARLVRSNSSTSSRGGALGSSTSFEVSRCELRGWTVELTPRRGGSNLSNHQARITGVPAACDWAVTDSTQASATVTGGNKDAMTVDVRIPGLADDVRTNKVDRVSAKVECKRWDGGSSTPTASGASIDGDRVRFSVTTPAVFDLRNACTISPRIHGDDGATVVPKKAGMDVRPAANGVVDRIGPTLVEALRSAQTGWIEERSPKRLGINNRLHVTMERGDIPCTFTHGASAWEVTASGGHRGGDCAKNVTRQLEFRREHVSPSGRANISYRVKLSGASSYSVTIDTDICALPSESKPPCTVIEECEWQGGIPADDPDCFEPCEHDPNIPADDPDCVAPCQWDPDIPADDPNCPDTCEWDPDLPADDPDCFEPCQWDPDVPAEDPNCVEPCEWDPDLPADDPNCVEPDDPPGDDPPGEDPGDGGGEP